MEAIPAEDRLYGYAEYLNKKQKEQQEAQNSRYTFKPNISGKEPAKPQLQES